ncbi:MAG: hypothetical protein IPK07_29365 [Deltaproteobacteria bacterium]|nr:hypothetical protein [Deltaproteobacteria bacterium]
MRALDVLRSDAISPVRDLAIQRHLLAQMERPREGAPRPPTLHLGWIAGSAIALGRFQRRRAALAAAVPGTVPVLVRSTGGRAVRMATGQLSVSLAMSDPSSGLPPGSGAIGAEKVINRYVRGVLGGLQKCGLRAYYFGRDFLSVDRKHGGYVSFEVAPGGATLFNALISVEATTVLPADWNGYPGDGGNRPDPETTTLATERGGAVDRGEIEAAIIGSYARLQEVEPRDRTLSPLEATLLGERESAVVWDGEAELFGEAEWRDSTLTPIACGWLQASVQVVQDRFLGAVRLFGDFMAPSGAIDSLERDLRLVPIDWREVGLVADRIFGGQRNPIVGVRQLRVIPDAILEAARGGAPGDGELPPAG